MLNQYHLEFHTRSFLYFSKLLLFLPTETPRVQEQSSNDDPLHILKYHLISKRLRLINHFKRERVGGDGVITMQQFKEGIKVPSYKYVSVLDRWVYS